VLIMPDPTAILSGNRDDPHTLVVVFLRGGADGLNMVAPLGDDGYFRARPRIAIRRENAIPLDDFFGLNPVLGGLAPAWNDGHLEIVHAVGSEDQTRSHFEAQDLMEHGGVTGGGWLGRFLRFKERPGEGGMTAIALSKGLPESLRGAPAATAMGSINEFTLGAKNRGLQDELAKLYARHPGLLAAAGRDTIKALEKLEELRSQRYQPANGAEYARDPFSRSLTQTAQLIRARLGVEAVTLEIGGWDSHLTQGSVMDPRMRELGNGLGAFYTDLGSEMDKVTVVVMTEFGRRVSENSAFGTDHGRASAMFVMGKDVNAGKVQGAWPGLTTDVLEGPGDLPVTTNYRNVLAPVLKRHGAGTGMDKVFPQFNLT
jgi:uncharacterized protein (DUF1501 family)